MTSDISSSCALTSSKFARHNLILIGTLLCEDFPVILALRSIFQSWYIVYVEYGVSAQESCITLEAHEGVRELF